MFYKIVKKKFMKKLIYTIAFSLVSFSVNAEGFYFGAGINQSELNLHKYSSLTYSDYDDKDLGFKILVGYDYSDRIGIEAVYNDLGEATATVGGPLTADTEVQSIALAAVVKSDSINNYTFFGKIGQNLLHAHDELSDGTANGVTEMNMYYGLGVSYATEEGAELRLEYEQFGAAGGTDTIRSDRPDEVDPSNLSISLIKKF